MGFETLIPLAEYLNTSYDPDVEYVDGALVERNVGDWPHSIVQSNLIFNVRRHYANVYVVPQLRSRTLPTRYRLPDVCILLFPLTTRYLLDAAYVAIEILSEDDSMTKVMERLEEYDRQGVPNIWLIDPRLRRMSVYQDGALSAVRGDRIVTVGELGLELFRAEIFQDLL